MCIYYDDSVMLIKTSMLLKKEVKVTTKLIKTYRMCFNFCRGYILRIFHIHRFHTFKFVDAGHCSVQIH